MRNERNGKNEITNKRKKIPLSNFKICMYMLFTQARSDYFIIFFYFTSYGKQHWVNLCTNVCVLLFLFLRIYLFSFWYSSVLAISPYVVCSSFLLFVNLPVSCTFGLRLFLFASSFPLLVALMREVHNELEAIRQEERNICNLDGTTGSHDKSESTKQPSHFFFLNFNLVSVILLLSLSLCHAAHFCFLSFLFFTYMHACVWCTKCYAYN